MASTQPKIILSRSQDIPFNKLVLSQANVRRVMAGVSIEELAEDIARRTLLQGLSVRSVRDADGNETGTYEVPAGGRRYRALELLVKQKRMAKTQPVPCIVRDGGLAEEDSLAENVQRVALHPLDQFRAFQSLRDTGLGEEEIAARFFVAPSVVKQRLRLAAVSPKLLDLYAEDEMTLEQLMAFTVTNNHARQEQVWDAIARSQISDEPYAIRRQLTESAVRASDRRARFVGIETYEAAGGLVMRDLFEQDRGGWLQDAALLDRLVVEKLTAEAEPIRAEGWKWIEAAVEFPYGHTVHLHRLPGETVALTEQEQARLDALRTEYDKLEEESAETEEVSDVDQRLGEIETELATFEDRPLLYDSADIPRAGVFISVDTDGELRIERGYVRPEDETPAEADEDAPDGPVRATVITVSGAEPPDAEGPEEDDGIKPLADRLVMELTAHRTLALRDALANDPGTAFVTVLHALCLSAFYRCTQYEPDTCLEITAKSAGFTAQAPGLADTAPAKAIDERHQSWARQLPEDPAKLWDALLALTTDQRDLLFAHCAALTINVVQHTSNRRSDVIAHGDRLALAIGLDMAANWTPTVDTYLGRVTKARILEAVREAKGAASAQLIDHLKKPDMAKEAERLLSGTGWLPEPLRLPAVENAEARSDDDTGNLPRFLVDAADDTTAPTQTESAAA